MIKEQFAKEIYKGKEYIIHVVAMSIGTYIRYDYNGFSQWYQIKIHPLPMLFRIESEHNWLEEQFIKILNDE